MTLIVAVDGSEPSTCAARAGLDLLGSCDDALVVTVVDLGDPMEVTGTGMAGGVMSEQAFDERERVRQQDGATIVSTAAEALGIPGAETQVLRGDPGTEICELAAKTSARGIVLGTRGNGGLKRAVLGSVSDHIVRNAPCPVVVTGFDD